ncbi:hypothetical protein ADL19_14805 [Streptomyces purpurogeneiscleroticus]|nr:hypothetical protein ADL19_14805 [Streptomyces purpurogeneiscleroticus]
MIGLGGFGRPPTCKNAIEDDMRRIDFDAILTHLRMKNNGSLPELRISMRNAEIYFGNLDFLYEGSEVFTLTEGDSTVYIALPAIATVSKAKP